MDGLLESLAIARKELTEISRQPAMLLLVVLGPFAVLAAFGVGYRNEELALRTIFVGPIDSQYEEAVERYADSIDDYVVPIAFTSDLFAATEDLRADRADVIIVLPPAPQDGVVSGESSEIAVLHNSIDPIEAVGIDFASEIAVRELNATVVTAALDAMLNALDDLETDGVDLATSLDQLDAVAAAGDADATRAAASVVSSRLDTAKPALDLLGSLDDSDDDRNSADVLRNYVDGVADDPNNRDPDQAREARGAATDIDNQLQMVRSLEPSVLARPFYGDAESLVRSGVSPEDHVAPGATALLIQHLGLSLAALSFVRDRRRGLLTSYRVGPTSVVSVMIGKLASLGSVTFIAGALVMAGQIFLLGVPQRGSWLDLSVTLLLVSLASVALGLLFAAFSKTELQASQLAMIALLIGLFFSGFILDLDLIREPWRSLGLAVPSQPALEVFRDVQLRGQSSGVRPLIVLASQVIVGVGVASGVLRHQWRLR